MPKKKRENSTRKPQQSRSVETVQAILIATTQILKSEGVAACSTNRIAERAGVSIGTLYQYFKDKQAVLAELFGREILKDGEAIEGVLKELERQPIEVIVPRLIEVVVARLGEDPQLRQALMLESYAVQGRQTLKDVKERLAEVITDYLKSHPQFQIPSNVRFEMFIIVNAVEAAVYASIRRFGPRLQKRRLVEEVSDLVLRYLSKYRVA